jgi:hypothetical protein
LAGRGDASRLWRAGWILALAVGGLRAVGLTTWGVAGAIDLGPAEATARVRAAVHAMPPASAVMVSSCFLYALTDERERALHHTDWVGPLTSRPDGRTLDLLILSQMEYHRTILPRLEALTAAGKLRVVAIDNHRTLPVPEDFPVLRRLFSHLSWAPVIVHVEWAE